MVTAASPKRFVKTFKGKNCNRIESTQLELNFMNSLMEELGVPLDKITTEIYFKVLSDNVKSPVSIFPFMMTSLRLSRMSRTSLEPISRSSLPLIKLVTNTAKLPTHVITGV